MLKCPSLEQSHIWQWLFFSVKLSFMTYSGSSFPSRFSMRVLFSIGALGDRGRFVDDPPTGLEKAVIPPGKNVRSALGLKEGGCTW